jgi:hypothetical protein
MRPGVRLARGIQATKKTPLGRCTEYPGMSIKARKANKETIAPPFRECQHTAHSQKGGRPFLVACGCVAW